MRFEQKKIRTAETSRSSLLAGGNSFRQADFAHPAVTFYLALHTVFHEFS